MYVCFVFLLGSVYSCYISHFLGLVYFRFVIVWVTVWLSVPVQLIAWKDSSLK